MEEKEPSNNDKIVKIRDKYVSKNVKYSTKKYFV